MNKIQELYQKLRSFEEQLSAEFKNKLECKNLCSRCCYVDLSVFEVEANNIKEWYSSLPPEQKHELTNIWKTIPQTETKNFHGEKALSCVFLKNESCTIYEARPLICRTQGLALKVKIQKEDFLDICPLNEDALTELRDKDVLNLELLNHLLSLIEQDDAEGEARARIPLVDLLAVFLEDQS